MRQRDRFVPLPLHKPARYAGVMPGEEMEEYVSIHGDKWKIFDINEQIKWAREQVWKKQKWLPRAALVSKGKTSEYVGQSYRPEYTRLVEDGWSHDHCEICWWSLYETDNPESGVGYTTDGRTWLCSECYEKFIVPKA